MIIDAYSDKSAEDAWSRFYEVAEREFGRLEGRKIWRSIPECTSRMRIEAGIEQWRVRARVLVVDEIPENMAEATVRGPYHGMKTEPYGLLFAGDLG